MWHPLKTRLHFGATSTPSDVKFELESPDMPATRSKNPKPTKKSPNANFTGIDGSIFLLERAIHK